MIMSSGISPNNPRNVNSSHHLTWHSGLQRKPAPQSKPPTPITCIVTANNSINNNDNNNNNCYNNAKLFNISKINDHNNNNSDNQPNYNQTNIANASMSLVDLKSNSHQRFSSSSLPRRLKPAAHKDRHQHEIYAPASIANPRELHYTKTNFGYKSTDLDSNATWDCETLPENANSRSKSLGRKSSLSKFRSGSSTWLGGLFERVGTLRRKQRKDSQSIYSTNNPENNSTRKSNNELDKLPNAEKIYAEGLQALEGNAKRRQTNIQALLDNCKPGQIVTYLDTESYDQENFKQLANNVKNWINDELACERIIVRDLFEDLYDGQVLGKLIEKLANIKLDTVEVTQNAETQRKRLEIVLAHTRRILGQSTRHQATDSSGQSKLASFAWSIDGIHNKNAVDILCLLICLARHFNAPIKLPPNVWLQVNVAQNSNNRIYSRSHSIQLTPDINEPTNSDKQFLNYEASSCLQKRDVFDTLVDFAPDKLTIVSNSLVKFVNSHLNKVNINLTTIPTTSGNFTLDAERFSDGILLVLLISSLENFFVPLGNLFTSTTGDIMPKTAIKPSSYTNAQPVERLHNVNVAFELLGDAGVDLGLVRPDDIANGDLKSVLRILYAVFRRSVQ